MTRGKLLAVLPFLLLPLAFVGISYSTGIEQQDARPAVVLPAQAQGPQVTMRPSSKGGPRPRPVEQPGQQGPPGQPGQPGQQGPDCDPDDDRDEGRDDDDTGDDDEVRIVQPCPDPVGDDDADDRADDGADDGAGDDDGYDADEDD